MKTFKDYLMEVQQPLSQGEKNFYAMHKPETKSFVPGVTDQDFVFKGNERREDPETASYENLRGNESEAAYDKNLKVHDNPSVQKEDAALAALAPPKDKVTHKDVLVGRGVLKKHPKDPNKHVLAKEEVEQIDEAKPKSYLDTIKKASKDSANRAPGSTPSWLTKAMADRKPDDVKFSYDMPDGRTGLGVHKAGEKIDKKKYPGYSVAKEETDLSEAGMPASVIKHKQALADLSDKEFAEKHGNKSEKELRDMAARHGYGWNKQTKTGSDHYLRRVERGKKANEEVELDEKTLTAAEINKREEVAKAIARENPKMDKSKKMAIATATAKRVAEAVLSAKQKKIASLKEPKDEIDADDLAALRRGEHKK